MRLGLSLRAAETGKLRQYVMFIVVGTVALFMLISCSGLHSLAGLKRDCMEYANA